MREVMYDVNSLLIAGGLFVAMISALELGYRLGRVFQASASEAPRAHVNAIQASLLGIVALVLGFTFSLALQRFESRSRAEVDEANAIGTAYLRAGLLPETVRDEARELLGKYVELRARASAISLDREAEREVLVAEATRVLESLWASARRAVAQDDGPVTSGLFAQALNEAIDSFGSRDAELRRHVPELILLLLFGTFLLTSGVVGYAAGIAGHRPLLATHILMLLIAVLTFIIVDLDRPRRGLIQVDQTSLIRLQGAIEADLRAPEGLWFD